MHFLRLTTVLATGMMLLTACHVGNRGVADELSQASTKAPAPSDTTSPQATPALGTFIKARKLAWDAAVMVQRPPHKVETWQAARVKWRQAINLLETIPEGTALATQAKEKMAVYQANYAAISDRLTTETKAIERFKSAQTLAWQAAVTVQKPPHTLKMWQRASEKWEAAIAVLQSIPPTTAIATQSQAKLPVYRSNLNAISQRLITERQAILTLNQFSAIASQLKSIPDNVYQANLTPQRVGIRYEDYTRLVEALQQAFNQFASQPDVKRHPLYPVLTAAIADHRLVLKLWKDYLAFKAANNQWLYDDVFDQFVPVSLSDATMLRQKYGLTTDANGEKVSLRLSAWTIWQKDSQQLQQVQQRMLSAN
ncbi:MAG: hypothetical protein KME27_30285 [Lyngbya sp. HA4199-MV5]|jgi:hypothetical protein|nr:hypothetical protein [Lyngbya sp. HA4199-MV5]